MMKILGFVAAALVIAAPAAAKEITVKMLNKGAEGAMGKDFVLKAGKPGLYGIKCLPHFSMGMVALVQVGNGPSANLAAAKAVKLSPLATKRMTAYLAKAK
ncbi:MAG: hypothetical protein B7Z35_07670 [Hydrogenophilales bacterium 12-61-10]|nr:MAG: hypothetical protein B7Z35_07670 [Hydrogenophilales bacterium 12-61-10]